LNNKAFRTANKNGSDIVRLGTIGNGAKQHTSRSSILHFGNSTVMCQNKELGPDGGAGFLLDLVAKDACRNIMAMLDDKDSEEIAN